MFDAISYLWFSFARTCGGVLRNARYASVDTIAPDATHVRKKRALFAPVLIRMGRWLLRVLNSGIEVLEQDEWHAREQFMYRELYNAEAIVESSGAILLPKLRGVTLASLLERHDLPLQEKIRAVGISAVSLEEFHARGFSHGDAMATNGLVVPSANRTYWIDFETAHESRLSLNERHADDLRAFISTVALRFAPANLPAVLETIDQSYENGEVKGLTAAYFSTVWHRALIFHLGQAPLSRETFLELGGLMKARL